MNRKKILIENNNTYYNTIIFRRKLRLVQIPKLVYVHMWMIVQYPVLLTIVKPVILLLISVLLSEDVPFWWKGGYKYIFFWRGHTQA